MEYQKTRRVVAVIIEKDDMLLFGRKAKNKRPYPNKWLLIGGGIEDNETVIEALRREVTEETAIELEDIEPLFIEEDDVVKDNERVHYVFLIVRARWKSGKPKPGDDIVELRWVKRDELVTLDLPSPSTRIFKKMGLL